FDLGLCYQKASQEAFKVAHDMAGSPESGAGAAPALAVAPVPEAPSPGQTQRVVGLIVGGAGVAALVGGAITGVMAKSAYDNALSHGAVPTAGAVASQVASAYDLATASTISFIAGAAALGTGAVIFFTAPKARPIGAVGLGPAAEGAGLAVAGRF